MDITVIEKAWRTLWMRAIARALPGTRSANIPRDLDRPLRVLFVRYERIGDMIMSTGMIRVLAESPVPMQLDVLANPATRPVLDNNPHVRRIFVLDRKSWKSYRDVGRMLRVENYDVIVDGRINNPPVFTSTPLLMLRAGAPYRVGVGGGNNNLVYNVCVAPYDRSVHYIEGSKALARPFGVEVDEADWRPEIFLSDAETERASEVWQRARTRVGSSVEPRLLVNLSASEPKRRWADDNFIEVLQAVRAAHPYVPVIVIGLPSEWNSVQHVAASVSAEPAATPALRDALALVGTSDMVLTPDTSISHAASAFSKPEVVLLKREHHPYAPWNAAARIVFWDGEPIKGLVPAAVTEAVLEMMKIDIARWTRPTSGDTASAVKAASRQSRT